jgi:hypothetical protein
MTESESEADIPPDLSDIPVTPAQPPVPGDPVQRAREVEPAEDADLDPVTDDELTQLDDHPEYAEPIADVMTPGTVDDDEIYDAGEDDIITEENYLQYLPTEEAAQEEGFKVDLDSGELDPHSQLNYEESPPDPQNLADVDGEYMTPDPEPTPTPTQ